MSVSGSRELFRRLLLLDQLIPEIIEIVLEAWSESPSPASNEHETAITRRFCVAIQQARDLRKSTFNVYIESPDLDAETGEEKGRLDLRFVPHGCFEREYFAFECKRLNVVYPSGRTAPLASEYVLDGMTRFLTGQYAKGLDKGGMLGYVMDGNVRAAMTAVDGAIAKKRTSLGMSPNSNLAPSSLLPEDHRVKETQHKPSNRDFVIHHVFLAVN